MWYHSSLSYESLCSTQIHSLATVFAFGHFPPRFCYCCPFGGEGDSIYHWTPSEWFQKEGEEKKRLRGPFSSFHFSRMCVFVVLSFPWWRWTKCSSVERALGLADSLSVLGVPVPKSKTHRPTAKRTRSAFALQHKRRITADELQPLAGVDKCVCVFWWWMVKWCF